MREQTASLLIGTLADQVLRDIEKGSVTVRGREAAQRLERLIQLVVSFRSGDLSETKPDPEVSASAAYSLLASAALGLGTLHDGFEGLVAYRHLLETFRAGHLQGSDRLSLEPFLQKLGQWSAEAAQSRVTALIPEQRDRRRRTWIHR